MAQAIHPLWNSLFARWSLTIALSFFAGLAAGQSPDAPQSLRPNILLIVADDLGWGDVGYHGSRIRTPHLDALARSSVELDCHYVQPQCTPTRAALLSGRYPGRFGAHALFPSNERVFPPETVTLASALKSLGYQTSLSGKWHLGAKYEWGPLHYGFDHAYGILTGAGDPWQHTYRPGPYVDTWHRDHRPVDERGQNMTELLAADAIQHIAQTEQPWFVYVPFTAVHIPIDTPEEYKKIYEGETFFKDSKKDDSFRRYAAFVSQLDAKVGQLLAALEERNLREKTLVIFLSDNGAIPGGDNPYAGGVPATPVLGSNLPLRGNKGGLYEGAIRVPAIVSWPGSLAPRKVTAPIHAVDWMPTLCGLAGYRSERDLQWDGCDIWPLLTGRADRRQKQTIFWSRDQQGFILRDGDWKLIVHGKQADAKVELFDLAADPYEKDNLATEHPEMVRAMREKIEQERQLDRP